LDWGSGQVRSKEKGEAIAEPVAVLVNRQTSGAAEALAGVLRQAAAALVLGHRTAGQAMIAQEYPLKNGDRLRIRINPVKLGDGSALSGDGLAPDISVDVSADDEQAYFADAYQQIPRVALSANTQLALTNAGASRNGRRTRFNEAELVRERRDGANSEPDVTVAREPEADVPTVRDPVLARALDVLKGLAVVRRAHS
jgi:C-terminal processing protease CtpA/Prc